jgi:hypothetical protein
MRGTLLVQALLLLAACSGGETQQEGIDCGPSGECPAGYTCDRARNRCIVSATSPDAPPPDAFLGCLPPTGGPTMHAAVELNADEVWTAAASPHIVTDQVRVNATATLTIEPCAEVVLAPRGGISVGARGTAAKLVAEGTELRQIRFHAQGTGAWGAIQVWTPGTASLAYASFEGGGGDASVENAQIYARGDGVLPLKQSLRVDHVTITGAQGAGVRLHRQAAFADGSTALTVTGSGALATATGNPIRIGAQAAGSVPPGTYTGNRTDTVLLQEDGDLHADLTLAARGVAYELGSFNDLRTFGTTLTFAGGVDLRVPAGRGVVVGVGNSGGAFVTQGTADLPVHLVAAGTAPWSAVTVFYPATIDLAYTALDDGGDNTFRSDSVITALGDNAAPVKPMVKVDHVLVHRAKGAGVDLEGFAGFIDGSTDFEISSSGSAPHPQPVVINIPAVGSLPSGSYTGNNRDEILVLTRQITDADTFHDRGVPYLLNNTLKVTPLTTDKTARLTLEAGVTLRFPKDAALTIGGGATGSPPYPGELIAAGTADKPVVLTAATGTVAGSWVGITFAVAEQGASDVAHTRIEYAGGPCLCVGFACTTRDDAAVIFYVYRPGRAFIHDSTIFASANHGILSGWSSDLSGPDFKATNTFDQVPGCAQVQWKSVTGGCPGAGTVCY